MTCEEVRERLSDHLLGTLSAEDSAVVAEHLRGCAACRAEGAAMSEGLAAFASAAHDREPPEELADRVRSVLLEEWRAEPASSRRTARWSKRLALAAALIAVLGSVSWGLSQQHRTSVASAEGASYVNLLHTLGGKEFRAGRLVPATGVAAGGSVVVYDSSKDQSWAAVFVRAPGTSGPATATLEAADGRTIKLWPMTIQPDGDGSTWIVTSADLGPFNHLILRSESGDVIATATIHPA